MQGRAAVRLASRLWRWPPQGRQQARRLTSLRPPQRSTTRTTTTATAEQSATTSDLKPAALPIDSLPRYPTLSTLGILRSLDYVGTISFAHTGALLAATSGMDLLGTTVVGTITAIGGGTIRDAIILRNRPFWTEETEYLYMSAVTAMMTFALWPRDQSDESVGHFVTDALGVGAFCVIGAQNGVRAGVPGVVSVVCGVATATFGGAVRDVLCRKEVRILHSHAEIYASTAAVGAATYLAARSAGLGVVSRVGMGVGSAFAGRCWAWMYGTRLPVWKRESGGRVVEVAGEIGGEKC